MIEVLQALLAMDQVISQDRISLQAGQSIRYPRNERSSMSNGRRLIPSGRDIPGIDYKYIYKLEIIDKSYYIVSVTIIDNNINKGLIQCIR